jgi:Flp pilus assembly protein TadD
MDAATRKATIGKAASLLAANPLGAEREARRALETAPSDPNAMLILGSALRRQGRAADSIADSAWP